MTITTLFYTLLAGMYLAVGVVYFDTDNAMAKCQEKHSYETCFQTLNR